MHHFSYSVIITEDITITYHGDTQMLFQFIYPREVSLPSECLSICPTMDGDEIGSCILESLTEVDKE